MTNKEVWEKYGGKEVRIVGYSEYRKDKIMTKGICIGSGYRNGYALIEATDSWDYGHQGHGGVVCGSKEKAGRCWYVPAIDIELVEDNFITF